MPLSVIQYKILSDIHIDVAQSIKGKLSEFFILDISLLNRDFWISYEQS